MEKKEILLIGGSGFVGSRFLDTYCSDSNYTNYDKNPSVKHNNISTLANIKDQTSLNNSLHGKDTVILLAAEHKDDVTPTSLYYDINVQGTRNVLEAMDLNGVNKIIFTSSVAVYGLNKINPNEEHAIDPFNHYGKSKWEAEEVLREWYYKSPTNRSLTIIRPTVIFGERNRGNVYNLLRQIASGKFLMIGKGENFKSMAYVGNIVAFIKYNLTKSESGYNVYNYIDKPDLSMNDLVKQVEKSLQKQIPSIKIPYPIGYFGGLCCDFLSKISGRKISISSIRVKKFCATTQFDSTKTHSSGYKAPYTIQEGLHNTLQYEFI